MKIAPQPISKKDFLKILRDIIIGVMHLWLDDEEFRKKHYHRVPNALEYYTGLMEGLMTDEIDWDVKTEEKTHEWKGINCAPTGRLEIAPQLISKKVFSKMLTEITDAFHEIDLKDENNFGERCRDIIDAFTYDEPLVAFLVSFDAIDWKVKEEEKE